MQDARQKQRVNLTLSRDLVEEARALGLNLSGTAEAALAVAVRQEKDRQWQADNAKAIVAHNSRIERDGALMASSWQRPEWKP